MLPFRRAIGGLALRVHHVDRDVDAKRDVETTGCQASSQASSSSTGQ